MSGQSLVIPARLQRPESLHALYFATVASYVSMQYGVRTTWWAGLSIGSPSSLPIKKLPPGIAIMPSGHEGAAGAARAAAALGTADAIALAVGAGTGVSGDFLFPSTAAAPPMARTAAAPSPTKSPILLDPGRRSVVDVCLAPDPFAGKAVAAASASPLFTETSYPAAPAH